jgi:hypothetical protein
MPNSVWGPAQVGHSNSHSQVTRTCRNDYLAAAAASSFGRYSATAACSVATWLGAKLIAQLSGTDGSKTANGLAGQLLAADRAFSDSCRPCLNALHQLAMAGNCCWGEQPPGTAGAAGVEGARPKCCASWLARMLPPLLAKRTALEVAGLKASLCKQGTQQQ